MPTSCFNYLTIVSENAEQLNQLINQNLKGKGAKDLLHFHANVDVIRKGAKGIYCMIMTYNLPNFVWLNNLISEYPECQIWNSWHEEGGPSGLWTAQKNEDDSQPQVRNIQWNELTTTQKTYYFLDKIPDV